MNVSRKVMFSRCCVSGPVCLGERCGRFLVIYLGVFHFFFFLLAGLRQVLKGIARCLVAEGQLEEAEQRFQKAMGMENARNPGASRAMLEYSQACVAWHLRTLEGTIERGLALQRASRYLRQVTPSFMCGSEFFLLFAPTNWLEFRSLPRPPSKIVLQFEDSHYFHGTKVKVIRLDESLSVCTMVMVVPWLVSERMD